MRKYFIILLSIAGSFAWSQPRVTKIFEQRYSELPVKTRIENSGIYGIASFDVANDTIVLSFYDSPDIVCVNPGGSQKKSDGVRIGLDVIAGTERMSKNVVTERKSPQTGSTVVRRSFVGNATMLLTGEGGELMSNENDRVSIRLLGRKTLHADFALPGFTKAFELAFPSNLAFADLIGIDSNGNSFFVVETYRSEIPLQVDREVYTCSPEGKILSILEIPPIRYCSTIKDFQIDSKGNFYHLLTEESSYSVLKWSGLTTPAVEIVVYPEQYNYTLHYNDVVPTQEPPVEIGKHPLAAASRTVALHLGESYVLHKYNCTSSNIAITDKTAPDGDLVRTPSWIIVGENARVGYKWGGFNTLEQYDAGLLAGKYAADINTAGSSSYAVGVDCSGFVSRCWQLSYHSATADMPGITTQYSSWDSLRPGDGILKSGHVRMFVEKAPNGALRVVESSGRDWGVSYWTYTPSELTGVYVPCRYTGMVTDYSMKQPELLSVATPATTTAKLAWTCDTAQVLGYRLYKSNDGAGWSLLADETSLHAMTAEVPLAGKQEYYRVSSVLNNGVKTESNWSNAMGASTVSSAKRILIVDGFERETGSWRGPGNTFAARYGTTVAKNGLKFESAKNSQLISGALVLSSYDAVFWILGDEATETETFSSAEQALVKQYLEGGGRLFVSGSEIGWDLSSQGSASDKSFYSNYLKASFLSDNSGAGSVAAVEGTAVAGCSFVIGQTYAEDYPDEIEPYGNSILCMKYSNGKGAGVQYAGAFGSSSVEGKIIYFAFSLETTANDSAFDAVITSALKFFGSTTSTIAQHDNAPVLYSLEQNYPNPFNPLTAISYQLTARSTVTLTVYDVLGREAARLVNEERPAGNYTVRWDASKYPTGIYFCRLKAGSFVETRKMVLAK